jgi:hypothetical protein
MKDGLFVSTQRLFSVIYTKNKIFRRVGCFRSSLSSFDLRPILKTRLFICKRVAEDLKITSHIWGKFKRVTQDSLKLCGSFYYNEKHWWQFQLALPIAAIFLFSRIRMRQHCISKSENTIILGISHREDEINAIVNTILTTLTLLSGELS